MRKIELPDPTHLLWSDGPPPTVGWWPASASKNPNILRWWDGVSWSEPAWPEYAENVAAQKAAMPMTENPQFIKWTCQWWVPASRKEMLKEVVLHHRDQLAELRDFKAASARAAEAAKAMISAQAAWHKLLQRVGVPA